MSKLEDELNKLLDVEGKFLGIFSPQRPKSTTIHGYKIKLKEYCQIIGLTPTEFINETNEEENKASGSKT